LAPAVFGWLLDLGITLQAQALWSLIGMVIAALLTVPVARPLRRMS
jgi:hypothetical protein